jgi:hypothetical protein
MTLHPQPLPPVPEGTVTAVQAAFPKGNLYVALCAEFGALYDDQLFADLYPLLGRPVEVAPWRLALVMIIQYEVLRWRTGDEQPPWAVRIASPYDLEARYSRNARPIGWAVRCTSPKLVMPTTPISSHRSSRPQRPRKIASCAQPFNKP